MGFSLLISLPKRLGGAIWKPAGAPALRSAASAAGSSSRTSARCTPG